MKIAKPTKNNNALSFRFLCPTVRTKNGGFRIAQNNNNKKQMANWNGNHQTLYSTIFIPVESK